MNDAKGAIKNESDVVNIHLKGIFIPTVTVRSDHGQRHYSQDYFRDFPMTLFSHGTVTVTDSWSDRSVGSALIVTVSDSRADVNMTQSVSQVFSVVAAAAFSSLSFFYRTNYSDL